MIKGNIKVDLTPEAVLNKISEYDIFRMYMPNRDWRLNRSTYSVFREEDGPSMLIGNRNGYLYFIDFGDTSKRGDCFDFVMMRFGLLSLYEALEKVDSDFGLGIKSPVANPKRYKEIVSKYKQPEDTGKRYSLIQVNVRKFTEKELDYWKEYYQEMEDLKRDHVYSLKEVFLNRRKYPLGLDEIRFGYFYEGGYWKIYRPFAGKKKKWLSNVPLTTVYGLENLVPDKNTLITKSLKDYMVCRKVYPHVCHVQNESLAAFSEETVEYINNNSNEVFYGGDSDTAGKTASYAITKAFGWKHINPPDRLLPAVNDFAGWGKIEGLDKLHEHFKLKGLTKWEKYLINGSVNTSGKHILR